MAAAMAMATTEVGATEAVGKEEGSTPAAARQVAATLVFAALLAAVVAGSKISVARSEAEATVVVGKG